MFHVIPKLSNGLVNSHKDCILLQFSDGMELEFRQVGADRVVTHYARYGGVFSAYKKRSFTLNEHKANLKVAYYRKLDAVSPDKIVEIPPKKLKGLSHVYNELASRLEYLRISGVFSN
jgi:hypothetical protein